MGSKNPREVMKTCVIMHNMIMEDEGVGVLQGLEFQRMSDPIQLPEHNSAMFHDFLQIHQHIRYRGTHEQF